jgi:hypothetical protein
VTGVQTCALPIWRLSVRAQQILAEPDISEVHKRAVERALRWAWKEVGKRWPAITKTGSEEQVTAKLHRVLNEHTHANRRAAPGLHSFETVNRGSKVEAADGRIELMPDLVFRPPLPVGVRNRGDWGYFVECKIVNGAASVGLYCTQGVERFTSGAYAASMPSGGMLAYVRDGTRPFVTLKAQLAKGYSTQSHRHISADTSESIHTRDALLTPCVDIALVHLWLCA